MKIAHETVTVLPNAALGEVNIVLAGLRITLTVDESTLLAGGLASSLEQLQAMRQREAAETWDVGRSKPVPPDPRQGPAGAESDTSLRTRALIQASMRDKVLSPREEPRE